MSTNQYIRYPTISGGVQTYPTFSSFPASAADGTLALALDTDYLYVYNVGSAAWFIIAAPDVALSVGTIDSGSPSANGAKILSDQLVMQSASGSFPGLVNLTTQTFAGNKTFTGTIGASNLSGTNTGDQTITLTGDVTGSGTGSFAATVASVGGSSAASVHTSQLLTAAATSANTASTLVLRNVSGNFSAGTITANLTGNASGSAGSFTGSLLGDVTGTQGATILSEIQGITVSGVTGTGNAVLSISPTLTGTLTAAQAAIPSTLTVGVP